MGASYGQLFTINATVEQLGAFISNPTFPLNLGLTYMMSSKEFGNIYYRFSHGATFASWGEIITITLTPINSSATSLSIQSQCASPMQVVDWGKNQSMVASIYNYIYMNIASFTTPVASQQSQQAQTTQRKFCGKCGAPLQAGVKFCGVCGAKL